MSAERVVPLLAALATRVARAAAARTPRAKAVAISRRLFGPEGFRYDARPRTLDRVLEEKRGNCLGLSLLYLCAAEKLDMAFHMLPFPTHALIRYDDGGERFNVEASRGGMVLRDDAVARFARAIELQPDLKPLVDKALGEQ